jgi:anti-sigma factor RsiW
MTAISLRDIERLSAFLDGELPRAEQARLDSRLARDPGLAAALEGLRAARALLHRTPLRRVPRHFTLTPKMAGLRPPLPRAVPVLRFASAAAALLLFLTFAGNLLGPIALGAQASAPMLAPASEYGGVGGGPAETEAVVTDKNLAIEAAATPTVLPPPAAAPMLAATPESTPMVETGPAELSTPTAEALRMEQPTPTPEILALEQPLPPPAPETAPEGEAQPAFRLSPWQIALLSLAVILGGASIVIRWRANRKFARNVTRDT